jgi:hypothetical protein
LKSRFGADFISSQLLLEVGIKVIYSASCDLQSIMHFIEKEFFKNFVRKVLPISSEYSLQKINELILRLVNLNEVSIIFTESSREVEVVGKIQMSRNIINVLKNYTSSPFQKSLKPPAPLTNYQQVKRSKVLVCPPTGHQSKISGVKWYQIALLKQIDFIATLKGLFSVSHVEMNSQRNEITFVAECCELLGRAKAHTISTLRTIVAAEVECANKEQLLCRWQTKKAFYLDLIKHLKCVVDVNNRSMFLYSTSHEQIKDCEKLILASL